MKTLHEIESILKGHMPLLKEQFNVKKMGIFGSLARGERKETDYVGILVQFSKPISSIKYMNLESYLSKLLGIKVDLVLKMGLRYQKAQEVLKEVVFV
jgi:predicted nucleotidyltransferase